MATEAILMKCVKAGGDRQDLHEAIRVHSLEAARRVKELALPNDLMERIANDPLFAPVHDCLSQMIDPMLFVGRAPEQTVEFITECVDPILEQYETLLRDCEEATFELKV
jgi:adenylosuccinate lyase